MIKRVCITVCSWCGTEVPNDMAEAQHHFFIAHGQAASQSVSYLYPGDVEAEFRSWADRPASA